MPDCVIYASTGEKVATFSTDTFGNTITIGRSSTCDVCLKSEVDTTVSRKHLLLQKNHDEWTLTNLSDRTSIYQNAEKVRSVKLNEGDVIRFTDLFFAFGHFAQPTDFDLAWDAETENYRKRGILWPGVNSIGSSKDNYVTIRREDISRIHGFIKVYGDHVTFRGNAMDNDTKINGEEVGLGEKEIFLGDELTLGNTIVRLVMGERFKTTYAAIQLTDDSPTSLASRREARQNRLLAIVLIVVFSIIIIFIAVFFSFLFLF